MRLNNEEKQYLEFVYECKDIYELQFKYYPKRSLSELLAGVKAVLAYDESGELPCFLEGIDYQKTKSWKKECEKK